MSFIHIVSIIPPSISSTEKLERRAGSILGCQIAEVLLELVGVAHAHDLEEV